jgi:hypothetical protein
MLGAKDLITADNVISTYTEGKYVCFVLKNGFVVKLNPNEILVKGEKHA